ncbi:hypothetical protein [Flectobacillus major]|uniref:hypothetical protein n=1 Tax=Flectobacillus major TaxID=103 RepID=UPI0004109D9C|nr:hypothetical protein [Flectobacillus major]
MITQIAKVFDAEYVQSYFTNKFEGVASPEQAIDTLASIKLIEFFQVFFKAEFKLQELWFEQDKNQLIRRLERCVTIEQKKKFIESKLDEHEILFSEHEYFDILEELGDETFGGLIMKLDKLRFGFENTSRWIELNETDKFYLSLVNEIPDTFPSFDVFENLTPQKVRNFIVSRPRLHELFNRFMRVKRGEVPVAQIIIKIVSDIFSIYYAIKLNHILRQEYLKLIPQSEYQLIGATQDEDEKDGKKVEIVLPKIKERIAGDNITSLSLTQTALLFNLLRKERVIFKDESYQSKENIYKAIQVLTGYSKQNLKVKMNLKEYEDSDKVVTQKILKRLMY